MGYLSGVTGSAGSERKTARGWTTLLLTFRFPDPLYNSIDGEDVAAFLKNPAIIDFARQLYFDENKTNDDTITYELKPEITLLKESH